MNDHLASRQLILIAGAEGGGLKLYGERIERSWRFSCDFVDQTPFMLAEDEDRREIRRVRKTVESWNEALAMLDQQRWMNLSPVMVHPEFRAKVWDAARTRLGEDPKNAGRLDRWRDRCDIS
jgi:hypothetical protein